MVVTAPLELFKIKMAGSIAQSVLCARLGHLSSEEMFTSVIQQPFYVA